MKKWLRRIRGALGMGVTWAVGWVPMGTITGLIVGIAVGFPLVGIAINYSLMFGVLGFAAGTIFSVTLGVAEGRRRFDELSRLRFVTWGALGGFLLGGSAVAIGLVGLGSSTFGAAVVGVSTLLGAGSAAATLAVAAAPKRVLLEEADTVMDPALKSAAGRRSLASKSSG